MAENKKIDDKDLVFINQQWTDEEKKSFSDFLKTRKKKQAAQRKGKNATPDNNFAEGSLGRKAS